MDRLSRASRDNFWLFKRELGLNLKPIKITDLIWIERQTNHQRDVPLVAGLPISVRPGRFGISISSGNA